MRWCRSRPRLHEGKLQRESRSNHNRLDSRLRGNDRQENGGNFLKRVGPKNDKKSKDLQKKMYKISLDLY